MRTNKTQETRPVVVITGVSSGIGLAIAEDLMQRGYLVRGAVRRLADADGLARCWGEAFVPLVFDMTDRDALNQAVTQVDAGKVFDVNVFGLLAVTRAFPPALGARRGGTGPKRRCPSCWRPCGTPLSRHGRASVIRSTRRGT